MCLTASEVVISSHPDTMAKYESNSIKKTQNLFLTVLTIF